MTHFFGDAKNVHLDQGKDAKDGEGKVDIAWNIHTQRDSKKNQQLQNRCDLATPDRL